MADPMPDALKASFETNVFVMKQVGLDDCRFVGVPCLVGISLDVERLLRRLGAKALKSKGRRATAFNGALVLEVRELPQ